MKLDAMKRQGQMSYLASDPLGPKLKCNVSVEVLATNIIKAFLKKSSEYFCPKKEYYLIIIYGQAHKSLKSIL